MPSELICNEAFYMSGMDIDDSKDRLGITVYAQDAWYFDDVICEKTLKEHFHCGTLEGLGIGDYDCGMVAAGALLQYLKETQKTSLSHMSRPVSYTHLDVYKRQGKDCAKAAGHLQVSMPIGESRPSELKEVPRIEEKQQGETIHGDDGGSH